jgi:hypothetical protein
MAVFVLVHGAWGGAHGFRKSAARFGRLVTRSSRRA